MASTEQLGRLHAVVPFAQATQREFGVPASVTLAQWITESSWGASQLAVECDNFFGVKASHVAAPETYEEFPTAEYESGKRVIVKASFRRYVSPMESFRDHAALLARAARYRPAMLSADHPQAFAVALQQCGYSTNPHYATGLLAMMREYGLQSFDVPVAPNNAPTERA